MKIICIGRNYTKHIEELSSERPDEICRFQSQIRQFFKATSVYNSEFSNEVHHEIELIVEN